MPAIRIHHHMCVYAAAVRYIVAFTPWPGHRVVNRRWKSPRGVWATSPDCSASPLPANRTCTCLNSAGTSLCRRAASKWWGQRARKYFPIANILKLIFLCPHSPGRSQWSGQLCRPRVTVEQPRLGHFQHILGPTKSLDLGTYNVNGILFIYRPTINRNSHSLSAIRWWLPESGAWSLDFTLVKHLPATGLGYPVLSRPSVYLEPVLVRRHSTAMELEGDCELAREIIGNLKLSSTHLIL